VAQVGEPWTASGPVTGLDGLGFDLALDHSGEMICVELGPPRSGKPSTLPGLSVWGTRVNPTLNPSPQAGRDVSLFPLSLPAGKGGRGDRGKPHPLSALKLRFVQLLRGHYY
jgi:hypothetical protein